MDTISQLIETMKSAIMDGHTVTIKADDISINTSTGETTVNGLEITVG